MNKWICEPLEWDETTLQFICPECGCNQLFVSVDTEQWPNYCLMCGERLRKED